MTDRPTALICVLILCAFAAGSLRAQERSTAPARSTVEITVLPDITPRQWILELQASATKMFGDASDTRFSNGGALTLRRHLLALNRGRAGALYGEFGAGFHDLQWKTSSEMIAVFDTLTAANDVNRSFVLPLHLAALWRTTVGPQAELFLGAGFEAVYYSPMNPNGDALPRPQEQYGKWTMGVPLRAEFEYLLGQHVSLTFNATWHWTFTDYLDGLAAGSASDAFLAFGLGVSYAFPARDTDSDYDGLLDRYETGFLHSNPENPDTDGDGLRDDEELALGTALTRADTDGDGLTDGDEVHRTGSSPLRKDSDDDGLTDMQESLAGTSPLRPDSDSDGLTDDQELARGSDPTVRDTDGDGLPDGLEVVSSPLLRDTDGDGIDDARESMDQLRPADEDFDGDGLFDGRESALGTDPKKPDTDNDGASDYAEVYGLMTDPRNPDSDGDGVPDGSDPDPLNRTPLNPLRNVDWTFIDLFLRGGEVDMNSKAFIQLRHLVRSAPRRQIEEIAISVYGRNTEETRDRAQHLQALMNRQSGSWPTPPIRVEIDVDPSSQLDARLRYIWSGPMPRR
jgi:hypothetical protein